MQIRVHATVNRQDGELMPLLGNPGDHQLEGDFACYVVEEQTFNMEINIWSLDDLDSAETNQMVTWVMQSLGFA